MKFYPLLSIVVLLALSGCSKASGDIDVREQTKLAEAGDQWAQYKLWKAYHDGIQGVNKNPMKADKWLNQFLQGVYVVRYEPANGFNPQNARDYLDDIHRRNPDWHSDQDRIGVAGFFRTKIKGNLLLASSLTDEPDKLRQYIEENPHLKFISVEAMTPQSFIEYEQSIQESLSRPVVEWANLPTARSETRPASEASGDIYISQQTKSAQADNRWAQFNLWDAYCNGAHGVNKNQAEADKWLNQFVKGVYVVRFEPAEGFHPQNPIDYLNSVRKYTPQVQSAANGVGLGSFFRTAKQGDKLVASFLTDQPDKLQAFIGSNPDLRFISSEVMTPQSFIEYEKSKQESLANPAANRKTPNISGNGRTEVEGIGAAISKKVMDEPVKVTSVAPESPAAKVGLRPGFLILAIDGRQTVSKSLYDCAMLIRGEPGTTVRLTVVDPDSRETNTVVATRGRIRIISGAGASGGSPIDNSSVTTTPVWFSKHWIIRTILLISLLAPGVIFFMRYLIRVNKPKSTLSANE